MSTDNPHNLTEVLDALEDKTKDHDTVKVDDILDAFAGRLFGPLIIIPGLILLTPLGAVPMLPAVMGALVALIAAQRLVGMSKPWVPRRLRERGVQRDKMTNAFNKARPWTNRIDKLIKPRLTALTTGPAEYAVALLALLLGASVPVVGLIPFAAMVPGTALTLSGLALIARDGALMIAALLASAAVIYLTYMALT
ncbi:MAG: exopolysaccharide biosynthesis protein [Phycisphaerales bacterium]|nr:exopolysaccharide biosynthesis protein [Phycisphaerales bacterium]